MSASYSCCGVGLIGTSDLIVHGGNDTSKAKYSLDSFPLMYGDR